MSILNKIRKVVGPACKQVDPGAIHQAVREKYTQVALSAGGFFQYPVGRAGAEQLNYPPELIEDAPESMLHSFCGVGNPFEIASITPGDIMLDIGCGAGFDLFVAGRLTGPDGRVCGIDLTQAMVERARKNVLTAGLENVEIKEATAEKIPYGDKIFDVVISNGVINLSPHKEKVFTEIHRVLKPGGRLQFSDMMLKEDLPPKVAGNLESWSN